MAASRRVFFSALILPALVLCASGAFELSVRSAQAQTSDSTTVDTAPGDLKTQIDALNQEVKTKQSRVKELDSLISNYKDKITEQEKTATTLQNEVLLLDDRARQKQLSIEQIKTEQDSLVLEIRSLDAQIKDRGQQIEKQKSYAADLVRQIRQADDVSPVEILLTKKSLSAFFDRLNEIKRIETNLADALNHVKSIKTDLESKEKNRTAKRLALDDQKKNLAKEQLALEAEKNFKTSLIDETKNKQTEFASALNEVRQQQQDAGDEIAKIQSSLKDKLDNIDKALARGDVLLNWPLDPSRGITAKFHDPTYPFKNMFPHPGTDVRAYVGTDIHAAAGGYIAWNKKGRLYGNYTMIIHPGNIATVYAHLSKFIGKPDSYVERGDVIGLSGGKPGDPGAGLSTGPHLHFEVRQNGIPVDPENFLPASGADEQ